MPQVQERVQQETQRLQALPAGQNPLLPGFQGDVLQVLGQVAPFAGLKWLIEYKKPIQNRLWMIQTLGQHAITTFAQGAADGS